MVCWVPVTNLKLESTVYRGFPETSGNPPPYAPGTIMNCEVVWNFMDGFLLF